MASSQGFCGKLRGVIIFIIIIIVVYNVFGNLFDEVLDGFGEPPKDEAIDIAEEYYAEKPIEELEENLSSSVTKWRSGNKWWQGTWKVPKDILDRAFAELNELEYVVYNKTRYSWVDNKYYRVLTNEYSTVNEFWEAVYLAVRDANEDRVERISDIFRYARDKHNLSRREVLDMVVTFTQHFEYLIPKDTIFEITPPLNTIIRNEGDCDTRSLLLGMILEDLGFDTLILYSSHYLHAIAGVDMGTGTHYRYKNKNYYTIETTATGWKVGMIPSEVDDMTYWFPIDL
jgi:hypothetical protein